MYTIIMNQEKMLITTKRTTIYEREKNVDMLRFLIPQHYVEAGEDLSLATFVVACKYTLPNNCPVCEKLELQENLYKDMLDYRLPVDTDITMMHGRVELRLTFLKSYTNEKGEHVDQVLHTGYAYIDIKELRDDYAMCDNSLEILDQYLLKMMEAEQRVNDKLADIDSLLAGKADDIEIIDGQIWAVSNGKPIGDPIPAPESGGNEWDEL